MDVIELNGQKYITLKDNNSNIRIVILQRGWVFVGMYVNNSDDEHMLINGFNYRYQGSKKRVSDTLRTMVQAKNASWIHVQHL